MSLWKAEPATVKTCTWPFESITCRSTTVDRCFSLPDPQPAKLSRRKDD